jgi:uncharacterized protein (TIGR02001 family)
LLDLNQVKITLLTISSFRFCFSKPVFTKLFYLLFLVPITSFADFHATLTGTTNNIGRWFTKSDNGFALIANMDYEHSSGLYAGTSVSNIDYENNESKGKAAHVEIIPYLGWSYKITDAWRLDTQWSRYLFDGDVFGHAADYNEFYLFLHYKDIFSGRISFAEDYYNLGAYSIDYELTGRYPFTDALEFSASFGYSQTKAALGSDYPYWNAGFTYSYKIISLDFRYMDATETSIDEVVAEKKHDLYDPPLIDSTFVFSVSMGF